LADAEPVDAVLDSRHRPPGVGDLQPITEIVARCFGAATVEDIIACLRRETGAAGAWASTVADELERRSPTSLKIAHRHVREAGAMDLRCTLVQDYRIAHRCLDGHDFYEGVRAVVVDKDQAPRWQPARLEEVSEAMLASYFAPPAGGDLLLASRETL